ncbi:MAG: hypothetical protein J1F67_04325 [Muribaculaceae bacterium]|nr:hypothetical protein [Muribaculaceae bacterium]
MVNVGIIGADSPMAGEIIRILINHPEVDIVSLFAPNLLGRNISSVHHGLIGENPLYFSDKINLEEVDFLAITQPNEIAQNIIDKVLEKENLKLTFFEDDFPQQTINENSEIGLSEINRKALVRGAKMAFIPSPVAVPPLISLVPLANFLLLNSDINIQVSLPADMSDKFNEDKEAKLIENQLKEKQNSFNGKVKLKISSDHLSDRAQKTLISLACSLPLDEIEKIYEQIYDDHNFTFLTRNAVNTAEVEGTQKTVINLNKPDSDTLIIETVSDARLRGGAGDVVHVMNLFFGLHEKTGLHLKPSRF